MKSGNGVVLKQGQEVRLSGAAVQKFRPICNRGVVTEAKYNTEQLVTVYLLGDDAPTDFHAKSLVVL